MCFMLMAKQRLPLVRKISCQKLTTNKISECFNYEVIQRLPRIPRIILVPKTFFGKSKYSEHFIECLQAIISIKNNNEQIKY